MFPAICLLVVYVRRFVDRLFENRAFCCQLLTQNRTPPPSPSTTKIDLECSSLLPPLPDMVYSSSLVTIRFVYQFERFYHILSQDGTLCHFNFLSPAFSSTIAKTYKLISHFLVMCKIQYWMTHPLTLIFSLPNNVPHYPFPNYPKAPPPPTHIYIS